MGVGEEGSAVISPYPLEPDVRLARVRALLEVVARRVAVDEAVGVLRCWWGCSAAQVRGELHTRYGDQINEYGGEVDVEAARVVAAANAAADRRADPDLDE
jgi:hypothetical protein